MFKLSSPQRLGFYFLILIFLALIYLYKIIPSYNYDSDFGRDITDILEITQGDQKLIGPKLSFGGIHTGPYYYYLFAPILFFFKSPESLIVANALYFILTLMIVFYLETKLNHYKENDNYYHILSIFLLAITPVMIFSARGPGNAFSYLALFLALIYLFPHLYQSNKIWLYVFYGFLWGIIVNFHLIVGLVFFVLMIFITIFFLKENKKNSRKLLALIFGFIFSFTPLFIFELRHDFVMFTNTFINKSYQGFTTNTNLPSPMPTSSNYLLNASFINQYFTNFSGLPFSLIFLFLLFFWYRYRHHLNQADTIINLSAVFAVLLFILIARSQLAIHYFFPFILITFIALIKTIMYSKNRLQLILMLVIIFLFQISPTSYSQANRQISDFREFSEELLASELFKNLNQQSFNIFVERETNLAVLGHEYRFFLEKAQIKPLSIFEYQQAEQLLVIIEKKDTDFEDLRSWELSQFGERELIASEKINHRDVLLFKKVKK